MLNLTEVESTPKNNRVIREVDGKWYMNILGDTKLYEVDPMVIEELREKEKRYLVYLECRNSRKLMYITYFEEVAREVAKLIDKPNCLVEVVTLTPYYPSYDFIRGLDEAKTSKKR